MAVKSSGGVKRVVEQVARILVGRPLPYTLPTRLDYRPAVVKGPVLSTGLRPLDKTLSIGGLPGGHITELIGPAVSPPSDGVMCLAAKIGAKTQRQQLPVAIIDLPHTFDPWLAERCGLMAPHLFLTRPDTMLAALSTLESAARSPGLALVNLGVVSDLLRHAEPDLLKTLLGRLRVIVRQSNGVFLFITIPLDNNPFNPANYPAGFPLAELAAVRLWTQNESWTYKDSLATAYKATVTVIKNRLAAPGLGADIRLKLA
jgi:RecA/RadA recombinase